MIACAGLHGNEPAGLEAARRVLADLDRHRVSLRGDFVAVAGNRRALEAGVRFLERDLNRCWTSADVEGLRVRPAASDGPEQAEQRELVEVLGEARPPLVLVDLHTTSGDSPPFTLMSDTLRNRPIAFRLGLPVVLGLEEAVDGTLLEYLTERGHRVVVVEAGRHDDPRSADLHEAVLWLTLAAAGAVEAADVPGLAARRAQLAAATRGLPRVVEVRHRHPVAEDDGFRMEEGFRGFDPVRKGQVLARDRSGPVAATENGLVLLPLYQEQGEDGFFLVRPVSRFWLMLSAVLRRLHLQALLPLLPGVEKHPDLPFSLRVNPKVARWYVVEIFHLFGYRKRRLDPPWLTFSRRRPR